MGKNKLKIPLYKANRQAILLGVMIFFMAVLSNFAFAFTGASLIESYTGTPDDVFSVGSTSNYKLGQQFIIGTTGTNQTWTLNGLSLYIYKQGTPTTCKFCIYSGNSTHMVDKLTCEDVNVLHLTSDSGGEWLNISMPHINFSQGGSYWINASSCDADQVRWRGDVSAPSYEGGSSYVDYSGDFRTDLDFNFMVWGTPGVSEVGTLSLNFSSYETAREDFLYQLTSTSTPTSPYLWYQGTNYTATVTGTAPNFNLSATIYPSSIGNYDLRFAWTSGGNLNQSDNYTQTIYPIQFGACNTTLTSRYINFTFKDEGTLALMNGTIDTSSWYYYISNANYNKSFSYSNSSLLNKNYAFCFSPSTRNVILNPVIQYSFTDYPQRRYATSGSYSSSVTNAILYLLSSLDGSYVTFQVLSGSEQPLAGVYATAERQISGSWVEVGSGYTGDDGGITFWVNPDYEHRFTFEKTGYATETTTLTPTQSTYTVHLGSGSSGATQTDYTQGVTWEIGPNLIMLSNGTSYVFNFSIASTYFTLSEFGFYMSNGSTNYGSNSSTSGSLVSYTLNTFVSNKTLIMNYYYIINGNYTNGTQVWTIGDTVDYGFGLRRFFSDLKTYMTDGFFGMNQFALTIIVFFVIFLIIGAVSYATGVYSPAAIVLELFALVALADIGAGLIASPINAVPYFPTIFTFFLAILIILWEANR